MATDKMRAVKYRGEWCAYWREEGKPIRRTLHVSTREEAERKLLDVERLAQGQRGETITAMMEVYLKEKKGRLARYRDIENAWKVIKPSIGHLRPDQIDRPWCRNYVAESKASPISIRNQFAYVRAGLNWVDKKNGATFELPDPPQPRERYLTHAEAKRLLTAADTLHIRGYIILALTTAARPTAVLQLTWDNINFDKGLINMGKSVRNKRRPILPMTDDARKVLLPLKEAALTPFVIEFGGKPLKSIKRAFNTACEAAKLEGVTPMVLRHTAGVWMAEAGTPMSEISQYMGHTSTAITEKHYARYSPQYMRKAASALDIGLSEVHKNTGVTDMKRAKSL